MKSLFQNLEPREQKTLLWGSVILVLMFGYFLVWEPLKIRTSELKAENADKQDTLQWMQRMAPRIKSLKSASGNTSATTGSVLGIVDRTAKAHQVSGQIKRIEPEGNQLVRTWFERVAFEPLMRWLDNLETQHGIHVKQIRIENRGQTGEVDARVTLSHGVPSS